MANANPQYPSKSAWFKDGNTNNRSKEHLNRVLTEIYPNLLNALKRQPAVRDESDAIELSLRIVDRISREYFRGKTWEVDSFDVVVKSYAFYEAKGFAAECQYSRHDSLDALMAPAEDDERVRHFEPVDPSTPVDEAVINADYVAQILSHPNLTPDDREVLRLRYVEGYSTDQIADYFDTNPNNIHQKIHRALRHAKDATDEDFGIAEGGGK